MKNARFMVGLAIFIAACVKPTPQTPPVLTYEVICPLTATEVVRDTIQASQSYYYTGTSLTFYYKVVGEKTSKTIQYPATCVVREIP